MASRSLCKNVRNLSPQFRTSVFTNDILRSNAASDFDKCHLHFATPHTYIVRRLSTRSDFLISDRSSGSNGQRTFFSFPSSSKTKQYQGKKLVGYSMDQMFEVVSDIEHYRDFVPFCQRSLVTLRQPERLRAELVVGFPPVRESYVSEVQLMRPRLVRAVCSEGKLFNHLVNHWRLNPGVPGNSRSCIIDFSVSFEFRSLLHSQLAHVFFNELVRQMEKAFVEEAQRRFGKPSVKTKLISTSNVIQAGP